MPGLLKGKRDRKKIYLVRVKELLAEPENWCQHGYAQLADGRVVERYDLDDAVRFSVEAAIHKSTGCARVVHCTELMVDLAETILVRCNGGLPRNHLDWEIGRDLLCIFSRLANHKDVVRLLVDTIARV